MEGAVGHKISIAAFFDSLAQLHEVPLKVSIISSEHDIFKGISITDSRVLVFRNQLFARQWLFLAS